MICCIVVPLRPPNSGSQVMRANPASNFSACQRLARYEVVVAARLERADVAGFGADDGRRVGLEPGAALVAPRRFFG